MHFSCPVCNAGFSRLGVGVPPEAAGPDQRVDLVDEQDRVGCHQLFQHRLQTLLNRRDTGYWP